MQHCGHMEWASRMASPAHWLHSPGPPQRATSPETVGTTWPWPVLASDSRTSRRDSMGQQPTRLDPGSGSTARISVGVAPAPPQPTQGRPTPGRRRTPRGDASPPPDHAGGRGLSYPAAAPTTSARWSAHPGGEREHLWAADQHPGSAPSRPESCGRTWCRRCSPPAPGRTRGKHPDQGTPAGPAGIRVVRIPAANQGRCRSAQRPWAGRIHPSRRSRRRRRSSRGSGPVRCRSRGVMVRPAAEAPDGPGHPIPGDPDDEPYQRHHQGQADDESEDDMGGAGLLG